MPEGREKYHASSHSSVVSIDVRIAAANHTAFILQRTNSPLSKEA